MAFDNVFDLVGQALLTGQPFPPVRGFGKTVEHDIDTGRVKGIHEDKRLGSGRIRFKILVGFQVFQNILNDQTQLVPGRAIFDSDGPINSSIRPTRKIHQRFTRQPRVGNGHQGFVELSYFGGAKADVLDDPVHVRRANPIALFEHPIQEDGQSRKQIRNEISCAQGYGHSHQPQTPKERSHVKSPLLKHGRNPHADHDELGELHEEALHGIAHARAAQHGDPAVHERRQGID